jgi:HSP20 family protein
VDVRTVAEQRNTKIATQGATSGGVRFLVPENRVPKVPGAAAARRPESDRYRHRTASTPVWPWFDEGRTIAQRLVGLPEDVIRVEESDEDGAHFVRAELPGIDPERDVEITITDGLLSVHAERREEKKEKTPHGYRTEFRYGAFARTLPLPAGAREDEVAATYIDGVLEIRVPVDAEQAKSATRRVDVRRG